jgi:RNA polymerase sigma-70 factor, ECF subfamily
MLVVLPRARGAAAETAAVEQPAPAIEPAAFPPDRFLPPDDPAWPGHWATAPAAWTALGMPVDGPEALEHARAAIADLPPTLRQVIVLRDLEGRTAIEVSQALSISPEEEHGAIQQARSLVRARLEQHFEGTGATT